MRGAGVGLVLTALVATTAAAQAPVVSIDPGSAQSTVVVSDLAVGGKDNPRYLTPPGNPAWDGVAQLWFRNSAGAVLSGCTGSLLVGGWDILTAAHCVNSASIASADVRFQVAPGVWTTLTVSTKAQMKIRPGYTGGVIEARDVAVLRLDALADAWIPRYSLLNGNPMGQRLLEIGYGTTGNGTTGASDGNSFFTDAVTRRQGANRFEAYCNTGGSSCSTTVSGGVPIAQRGVLVSDFDSGITNEGICKWFGFAPSAGTLPFGPVLCQNGYGLDEVGLGPGDSGGPAFVAGQIAGVASWIARIDAGPTGGFGALNGHACVARWATTLTAAVDDDCMANYKFVDAAMVPEPATYFLVGTGLGLMGLIRRRRA
ncbi:MAG: trypsin-like serine protease [Gemmatimonadetes bacterium]|nr:trypsin-like serine protease [Gemmatimonadota bacterium]